LCSPPRSLKGGEDITEVAEGVAAELVGRLERAWNEADGQAFGEPLAPDADFVDIRGEHHRGREAIAAGHQAIFDSIYEGSTVAYELTGARELSGEVILAHATAVLMAPSDPLAGEHSSMLSMVLVRGGDGWEIASFHNTLVVPQQR
jgi:uncharacterized protein (TIGR02246 family)